jgi:hypothetical protein
MCSVGAPQDHRQGLVAAFCTFGKKASEVMSKSAATPTKPASAKQTTKVKAAVAPESGGHATNGKPVSEDAIRLRAYQIWAAAGMPEGDGVQFWLKAEQELSCGK